MKNGVTTVILLAAVVLAVGEAGADTMYFNKAADDWNTVTNWDPNENAVPGAADTAVIGYWASPNGYNGAAAATLSSGAAQALGVLTLGSGKAGTLTVTAANTVLNVASNSTVGTGNTVAGNLNATSGGIVNFGGDLTVQCASSTISIDGSSQINMTGAGKTLHLREGTYTLAMVNTAAGGKFSVPVDTNLKLGDGYSSTLTVSPTASIDGGTTFAVLDPSLGSASSAASTLIVNGGLLTFSGTANLGRPGYHKCDLSVTNGGVVNFAGDLAFNAGGGQTSSITCDANSRINMTGAGKTLYFSKGLYNRDIVNTPGNGKFSVPTSTIMGEVGGGAIVNFSSETDATLASFAPSLGSSDGVTRTINVNGGRLSFTGDSNLGRTVWYAVMVNITNGGSMTSGATLTVNQNSAITLGTGGAITAATLTVNRTATTTYPRIQGAGTVSVGGTFTDNGRVTADGGTLTLGYAAFARTTTLSLTMGDGGLAGWYAINGGKLVLPTLAITGANINWGEVSTWPATPLVNSVRMSDWAGADLDGTLAVSLLATNHPSVTAGLVNPVGVWELTPAGLDVSSVNVRLRYDSLAADALGVEANLKLFCNSGESWKQVTTGFNLDTANKLIDGTLPGGVSQLAVASDVIVIIAGTVIMIH